MRMADNDIFASLFYCRENAKASEKQKLELRSPCIPPLISRKTNSNIKEILFGIPSVGMDSSGIE